MHKIYGKRLLIAVATAALILSGTVACSGSKSNSSQQSMGNCTTIVPVTEQRCSLNWQNEVYTTADAADRADVTAGDRYETTVTILSYGNCLIGEVRAGDFECSPVANDITADGPPGAIIENNLPPGKPIYVHRLQ